MTHKCQDTSPHYTALVEVETPRGTRYQGISYAAAKWRSRYDLRLPRLATVVYRTRPLIRRNEAYEQARSATISHNVWCMDDGS